MGPNGVHIPGNHHKNRFWAFWKLVENIGFWPKTLILSQNGQILAGAQCSPALRAWKFLKIKMIFLGRFNSDFCRVKDMCTPGGSYTALEKRKLWKNQKSIFMNFKGGKWPFLVPLSWIFPYWQPRGGLAGQVPQTKFVFQSPNIEMFGFFSKALQNVLNGPIGAYGPVGVHKWRRTS